VTIGEQLFLTAGAPAAGNVCPAFAGCSRVGQVLPTSKCISLLFWNLGSEAVQDAAVARCSRGGRA
jgi:hypothetical protein